MIKFRIHYLGKGEVQIWKSVGKMSKLLAFKNIFWHILTKMKNNLAQECVRFP